MKLEKILRYAVPKLEGSTSGCVADSLMYDGSLQLLGVMVIYCYF